METLKDIIRFFFSNKKYFLIPIIIFLAAFMNVKSIPSARVPKGGFVMTQSAIF